MASQLRNLIKLILEEYVSSLPTRQQVMSPTAKKVRISDFPPPRISGKVINSSDRNFYGGHSSKKYDSKTKNELSDNTIKIILAKYTASGTDILDALANNEELRKELGLGNSQLKNSDYYKRIYRIAVNETN